LGGIESAITEESIPPEEWNIYILSQQCLGAGGGMERRMPSIYNMPSCAVILEQSMGLGTDRNRVLVPARQSRNLKSRYGARNRFQEPGLELSSQVT
jgi:hypothetical protein